MTPCARLGLLATLALLFASAPEPSAQTYVISELGPVSSSGARA